MPRRYSRETWQKLRDLYVAGASTRQLAKQTGVPLGTICAHCTKEGWNAQRHQLATIGANEVAPGSHEQLVREVVRQNRLATLRNESATAKILSERALERAEAGLKVETLEDVISAQEYRARLWPSTPADPSMRIDIGTPATDETGSITLVLKYDHERPRQ